jgi:tRNA-splicing ligase RtcB
VGDRAEVFMTPELLGRIEGEAMAQLTNTAKQPGIRRTLLMPDGHVGYGCPVGTVAIAEDWIYPPLAGFDIGCFTADTLVPTVDGRSYPIGKLAEAGQDILVYALDEDHRIVVAHATARKTRTNAPLVRVMLDHEREIVCTPDHEFMLRDGTYRQAQDLVPGTSLMPFSLERDRERYMCVRHPASVHRERVHWLMARQGLLGPIPSFEGQRTIIHHRNFTPWDNRPDNLDFLGAGEHAVYHKSMRERYAHFQSEAFERARVAALARKAQTPAGHAYFAERGTKNILAYMTNHPEQYRAAVAGNGERGQPYLRAYNLSDKGGAKSSEIAHRTHRCETCGEVIAGGGFGIHNHRRRVHGYNHKVVSVERLSHREDVYCLTVPGYGNFALDAGVFVHNCGMQVVTSALDADAISQHDLQELMADISKHIAMGTGQGFGLVTDDELERYLAGGIGAMIPDGYATADDITRTEEPCLQPTGRQYISHKAFQRGMKTAGSLGGGNHFLEGQRVRVVDADLCQTWGLCEGQFVFQIHCGSRGLGHQVGDEYLKVAMEYMKAHDIPIVHRELVGMPLDSPQGQAYLAAMYTAANFSTINRQLIMHHLRAGFRRVFRVGHKKSDLRLGLLYNTPHNVTRAETLTDSTVGIVHRKGATRACPAGHPRTPPAYKETGHPVLIPSAMGMPSYILVGLPGGAVSEYSVNHGAGRQLSRAQAKKTLANEEVLRALGNVRLNQQVRAVIDEAPQAYKPIDLIIEAVEQAGLARVVARLEPLFCMKGTG